jgi:putative N6-adenine-specific DNA methylase
VENNYDFIATTMFGLEDVLKKELIALNANNIKVGNRCVYFQGNQNLMYRANIKLRTALKILKKIKIFKAKKEAELYKHISRIKWYHLLSETDTFSVSSTVNSKYFTHSNYVSLVVKDAIVDQFRKKTNKRPSVDLKKPDLNIHIHISNNYCTVSLNSSGDSLHKRGYRSNKFHAPINEVLAAGIILISDWDVKKTLIDPMCGSGTFLIEAALFAINRAPNIYRENFGFQNWKDYNHSMFKEIKSEIKTEEISFNGNIKGHDISANSIAISRKHIENMNLNKVIQVSGKDFFQTIGESDTVLIFNPPYGKRIEIKQNYYKEIGNTLKQKHTNTSAWLISSELEKIKTIGLKTSRKIKLFNGPLECRLLKYELYKGSRKINKSQNEQQDRQQDY